MTTASVTATPAHGLLDQLSSLLRAGSTEGLTPSPFEVLLAIAMSFGLCCLIAATYRRTCRPVFYSQDYVHTLIILGTVVTLVIMVVQGNAATAFGMFAAFSIIRFRRAVSQSRDIGFIFLAMASGLAVGAREYALAAITVPLICAITGVLAGRNLFAARADWLRLRVRVGADVDHETALREAFSRHLERYELRSVETIQAGLQQEAVYDICLRDQGGQQAFIGAVQAATGNNRVMLQRADLVADSDD
jgi:hypothetical protein